MCVMCLSGPTCLTMIAIFAVLVILYLISLFAWKNSDSRIGGAQPEQTPAPKKKSLVSKILKTGLMIAPLALLAL